MPSRILKASTLAAAALLTLAGPSAGDAAAGTLCVRWAIDYFETTTLRLANATYSFTIMQYGQKSTLQSMPAVPNYERVCVSNAELHGQRWFISTLVYRDGRQDGTTITLGDSPLLDMGDPGENREVMLTVTGPAQFRIY